MGGVIGLAMCKDEADVTPTVIRHMLAQVDQVLVHDNGSTDGTLELLHDIARDDDRLRVHIDDDPAHYQSRKMTGWARDAFDSGFDWVVPFDFDEIWSSPHGRIADVLPQVRLPYAIAWMHDHIPTDLDNGAEPDPFHRIRWRHRGRGDLPKISCRTHPMLVIHDGNHGASPPGVVGDGVLEIRHFPWRTRAQAITKARNGAAALAATDLPAGVGWHWREYGALLDLGGEEALIEKVRSDRWVADPRDDPRYVEDPAPLALQPTA